MKKYLFIILFLSIILTGCSGDEILINRNTNTTIINNYTTTNNITYNITTYINTTNNISSGVMEVNLTESGSTIQLTKQYADGSIKIDNITDTSGSGQNTSYLNSSFWKNGQNVSQQLCFVNGCFNSTNSFLDDTGAGGGLTNGSGANFTRLYVGNQTVKTYTTRNMTRANQNYTNSSNYSIQRVENLSLTLSPLQTYKIHCDILTKTSVATTGQRLVINYTDLSGNKINATVSQWSWTKADSATIIGAYDQYTPNGSNFLTAGGTTTVSQSWLNGIVLTNGNNTVINYWMASELATPLQMVNVTAGSECEARLIENI